MSDVTEDDLRAALMQALHDALPKEVGKDEFTVRDWMARWGLRRPVAEGNLMQLMAMGLIERIPEKRIQNGHLAIAYREVIKTDK